MRSLVLALSLATALPSQSQPKIVWHTDNNPVGNSGNAFPWGSEGIRYQTIVSYSQMGGVPVVIKDVFVPGDAALGDSEVVYSDIEIRMGVTQQLVAATNWAANNPNPTTVYRGPLRVAFRNGQWSGLALPNTYLYLPLSANDHLCFEVIVWAVKDRGKSTVTAPNFMYTLTGSANRVFLYQWVQNGAYTNPNPPLTGSGAGKMGLLLTDGNIVPLGQGCMSSSSTPLVLSGDPGKWPQVNQVFNFNLTGAKPTTPIFLALGAREDMWGGLQLPIDLAVINAPGCLIYHDIVSSVGFVTDPAGSAKLPVSIPQSAYDFRVRATWLAIDAQANPFGWTTSNFASLIIGL